MTLNEARTLANINDRAVTLWADGYTSRPASSDPAVWIVSKPGSDLPDYAVDSRNGFCTCKSFEHRNCCKHSIAVVQMVNELAAAEGAAFAEWCERMDDAECATGCDPYAEL